MHLKWTMMATATTMTTKPGDTGLFKWLTVRWWHYSSYVRYFRWQYVHASCKFCNTVSNDDDLYYLIKMRIRLFVHIFLHYNIIRVSHYFLSPQKEIQSNRIWISLWILCLLATSLACAAMSIEQYWTSHSTGTFWISEIIEMLSRWPKDKPDW